MHSCRHVFGNTQPAVKVPVVRAFGNGTAPFALLVLADVVFDAVEQAVTVLAFDGDLESFLPG